MQCLALLVQIWVWGFTLEPQPESCEETTPGLNPHPPHLSGSLQLCQYAEQLQQYAEQVSRERYTDSAKNAQMNTM